jgi:hypothetical protein
VYVAGRTSGTLAGQSSFGSGDGFAMRFDPSGNLAWQRQFGGADSENVSGIGVDPTGSVIVTGSISLENQDASFLRKLVE